MDVLAFFSQIVAFTYHKLVLAYGTNRNMLMILSWRTQKAANSKQYFYLTFGIGPSRRKTNDLTDTETYAFYFLLAYCHSSFLFGILVSWLNDASRLWNPHILLSSRLQERFNKRRSLIDLVQYLIDTIAPLSALHAFTRIRLQSSRAFCQMMCYDAALALNLQVRAFSCSSIHFTCSDWKELNFQFPKKKERYYGTNYVGNMYLSGLDDKKSCGNL